MNDLLVKNGSFAHSSHPPKKAEAGGSVDNSKSRPINLSRFFAGADATAVFVNGKIYMTKKSETNDGKKGKKSCAFLTLYVSSEVLPLLRRRWWRLLASARTKGEDSEGPFFDFFYFEETSGPYMVMMFERDGQTLWICG